MHRKEKTTHLGLGMKVMKTLSLLSQHRHFMFRLINHKENP